MGRCFLYALAILCCALCPLAHSQPDHPYEFLDHLAGTWVLQGTIAGKPTIHDIQADWLLNREYLQIHEVSREKNSAGRPAYEAIVLVGWDPKADQYDLLWLDTTGGGGLSGRGIGHGNRTGDSIPFLIVISPAESLHTTFKYDAKSGTWQWLIDDETNGKTDRFADVKLTRAK